MTKATNPGVWMAILGTVCMSAGAAGDYQAPPIGPEAISELAALPLLRTGTQFLGTDSHDASGNNNDGFQSAYSYLYKDGDEWVLFEDEGPGCVYVVRTIGHKGRLRAYLDGADRPAIDLPFSEVYAGNTPPFAPVFVGDEAVAHGSSWSYVPIPYAKGCRIVTDEMEPPHFYNIFAHKLPVTAKVRSYSPDTSLEAAAAWWSDPTTLPGANTGDTVESETVIAPYGRATIFEKTGAGAVTAIRIKVPDLLAAADLRIKAWWDDGAVVAAVDAPVSSFFGLGDARALHAQTLFDPDKAQTKRCLLGRVPVRSLFVGEDEEGWFYCHFPMPFWNSARIELFNESGTREIPLECAVRAHGRTYPENAAYFHARWRSVERTLYGEDFVVLDTRGSGHFVGCTLTMSGVHHDPERHEFPDRGHLEGDARFYIDDSRTPIVASTGTEEYFNWGWYDLPKHDAPFSYPTHGAPLHVVGQQDHSVMYRFHAGGVVPYHRAFRFELEHGPVGTHEALYSGTAYYYERPGSQLVRTDELDIGAEASEKAHEYAEDGTLGTGTRLLPYEGSSQLMRTEDAPRDRIGALKDEGRAWRGACRFTVRVADDNAGARLRRRSYYGFEANGDIVPNPPKPVLTPGQRVQVAVDGEPAGEWYVPSGHARETWRDTDFDIPAALTEGKSTVTVTLTALDGTHWDAYTYWVYSYVPSTL